MHHYLSGYPALARSLLLQAEALGPGVKGDGTPGNSAGEELRVAGASPCTAVHI